jgi:hypothetical protein
VRDQVSHPYSTSGKITVLYTLIFRFFHIRREEKRFWTEWYKHSPNLIYSWFQHECHSDLLDNSQATIFSVKILNLSAILQTRHTTCLSLSNVSTIVL